MSIATTVSILHVRPIEGGGGAENRSDAVVAVGLATCGANPGANELFTFPEAFRVSTCRGLGAAESGHSEKGSVGLRSGTPSLVMPDPKTYNAAKWNSKLIGSHWWLNVQGLDCSECLMLIRRLHPRNTISAATATRSDSKPFAVQCPRQFQVPGSLWEDNYIPRYGVGIPDFNIQLASRWRNHNVSSWFYSLPSPRYRVNIEYFCFSVCLDACCVLGLLDVHFASICHCICKSRAIRMR